MSDDLVVLVCFNFNLKNDLRARTCRAAKVVNWANIGIRCSLLYRTVSFSLLHVLQPILGLSVSFHFTSAHGYLSSEANDVYTIHSIAMAHRQLINERHWTVWHARVHLLNILFQVDVIEFKNSKQGWTQRNLGMLLMDVWMKSAVAILIFEGLIFRPLGFTFTGPIKKKKNDCFYVHCLGIRNASRAHSK